MKKFLSSAVFFLMSLPVLAATEEMSNVDAPAATVDMVYVAIFVIGFIGMIVGFFIYLWWNDRKKKPE